MNIFGTKWEVRRTIWPYPEGWGTYLPCKRLIADTGLSKEEAEKRCQELNNQQGKHNERNS